MGTYIPIDTTVIHHSQMSKSKKKNAGQFGLKILDANLGSGRSDAVLGWGNIGWDLVNKGERYGICSLTC